MPSLLGNLAKLAQQKADGNSETVKIELNRNGYCVHHPDIQLRKKTLLGWQTVRDVCPRCAESHELEMQMKRLKLISDGLSSSDGGGVLAALLGQGNTQSEANATTEVWPGEIQKGMHVRCVSCSRGSGRVSVGDVGVVKSRDSDNDYVVDFPKQDNWCGRPSDLVIDHEAEKVRPGALVTIKDSVTQPLFHWGSFERGMHGIVVKVEHDGRVAVQCGFLPSDDPKEGLWNSQLQELTVIDDGRFAGSSFRGKWSGKLQLGQAVRVPASLDSPSTGWGNLKRHDIGYVRHYIEGANAYVCDFPSADGWKGRAADLEVEPKATLIRPGKQVRVREGITPRYGWGSVTSSSVGTVLSCSYDARIIVVKFPEDSTWFGTLADLETIDSTGTSGTGSSEAEELLGALLQAILTEQGNKSSDDDDATELWPGEIQKGMHVRCVACSRGSGKVSIGDVGVVKSQDDDGDYRVDFPKQDNWCGRPSDIVIDHEAEKVRPGALVTVKDCVTQPLFQWGSFKRGMHGIVMKVEHDGRVAVQCGFVPDLKEGLWSAQLQELRVIDDGSFNGSFRGNWSGRLQLGQAVRVPASMDSPSTGWGSLKRHDIGYVRYYIEESNAYICDFPSVDGWKGRASDLEVERTATLIRPGRQVRVRDGVTPSQGWASVTSSSVGTVLSCSYDGKKVVVRFPENLAWVGSLSDLETHDHCRSCPGGHGLKLFRTTGEDSQICDFCRRPSGPAHSLMYGCRQCNIDCCLSCYAPPTAVPVVTSSSSVNVDVPMAWVEPVGTTTTTSSPSSKNPTGATTTSSPSANTTSSPSSNTTSSPSSNTTSSPSSNKFAKGSTVVVKGLSASVHYNGKTAEVGDIENEKYVIKIKLDDNTERLLKVKEQNLMLPETTYAVGTYVKLCNIQQRPQLNGMITSLRGFDACTGRYLISPSATSTMKILPSNFQVMDDVVDLE